MSNSVQDLLGANTHDIKISPFHQSLSINLRSLIETSEIIWQSKACPGHAVIKCSANVVVKIVPNQEDYTEYTSMQYLMDQIPELPAPRPLGLIVSNGTSYIFMSFVPGLTLDTIWPQLSIKEKVSISHQLNDWLLKLRALKRPDDMPLGGVCKEGCKDTTPGSAKTLYAPVQNSTSGSLIHILGVPCTFPSYVAFRQPARPPSFSRMEIFGQRISWYNMISMVSNYYRNS